MREFWVKAAKANESMSDEQFKNALRPKGFTPDQEYLCLGTEIDRNSAETFVLVNDDGRIKRVNIGGIEWQFVRFDGQEHPPTEKKAKKAEEIF